jgi:hypothetical protein
VEDEAEAEAIFTVARAGECGGQADKWGWGLCTCWQTVLYREPLCALCPGLGAIYRYVENTQSRKDNE